MATINQQLALDSLKRSAKLSPAKKIHMALELSQLVFELRHAIQKKKKPNERSRVDQKLAKQFSL